MARYATVPSAQHGPDRCGSGLHRYRHHLRNSRADSCKNQALRFALNWIEYNHWGYVWILVGLLSIVSSRWPPISETWGYTVLTGQSAAWALFYAAGIVFNDAPMSTLSGVLSWGLIGFMWWAISGLVNPRC